MSENHEIIAPHFFLFATEIYFGELEMQITFIRIIVWLIVGALAGSLVGSVVKRSREGFGWWTNLGVGLIGAAVGGFFFNLFGIDLGLGELAISFQDLVAAFMGSLIFLAAVLIVRKQMAKKRGLPSA